jgi:general nucleoside transport system permease protein
VRAPLRLRLQPVAVPPSRLDLVVRIAGAVGLALAFGAVVLWAAGESVSTAYGALFRGGFGSTRALAATVNKAVPIGLCALGIVLAYRAGLWNIGAEGQLYLGAFAAAGVGLWLPGGTPPLVGVPLALAAGVAAGLLWAGIAAVARAWLGVNEILSTLMLNYIGILWVDFLVFGPWRDPATFSFPYSRPLVAGARLPGLALGVHSGVFLLVLATAVLVVADRWSRWGYGLRVSGVAPQAARYGGIRSKLTIVSALCLAGALAGLAGAVEVSATTGRLQSGLSPGYGFMAILVAWLGASSPVGALVVAVVFAGLLNGAFALQTSGISPAVGTILQASLLLCVLAVLALRHYRIRVISARTAPSDEWVGAER